MDIWGNKRISKGEKKTRQIREWERGSVFPEKTNAPKYHLFMFR